MTRLDPAFLNAPLAHRALHGPGRPENALSAVVAAVDAGYGIEVDIQMSVDGRAMVFHDDTLDRMTDRKGPISEHSAEALGGTALLGGSGEGIPTLAEILAAVAGRVPLLIEIKDQHGGLGPVDGRLEQAVTDDLAVYAGPVGLMSFNPHSVAACAVAAPHIARGLTTCGFAKRDWPTVPDTSVTDLINIASFDDVGAAFISHFFGELDTPPVARIKAAGHPVLCWTIRSPEHEASARRIADNVTFEGYLP